MLYSSFGSNMVSKLGFGGIRFPSYEHDDQHVDIEKSVEMLVRSFDLGVNIVDTSPVYRKGESEKAIGEALKMTGNRVYVCTKFPFFFNPKRGEYFKYLEDSLKRLNVEFIDYYYFHGISKDIFDNIIIPQSFLADALSAKEQGLIKHISFSFHDKPEAMKYIIDKSDGIMETVLCQYNIIDRSNRDAINYAKSKNLGVAIMGPLGGGKFMLPPELATIKPDMKSNSSAETAFKFILSNPDVDVVFSGMKDMRIIEENARIFSNEQVSIGADFTDKIDKMVAENEKMTECYCTECAYCMPCPMKINIPYVLRLLNFHRVDGLTDYAKKKFAAFSDNLDVPTSLIGSSQPISSGENPAVCIACGKCERKCPQHIKITEKIAEAIRILGRV